MPSTARVRFQRGLDGGLGLDGLAKGEVGGTLGLEEQIRGNAELGEVVRERSDLRLGDSADEVRLDILRLGVGRVVHVAADVEVVVVGVHDLGLRHEARVLGQLALVGEDEIDLLDVLGAKPVLVLALCVFAIGVDEEDLVLESVGLALVADQHAGGDARAVEEAGRQADDGLYAVVVDENLADELFLTTAEQDPVRHDRRHPAVGLEAGEHVLHEHEVRLLAGLRAPLAEAAGELHAGAAVVLRKRWVGEHTVELADLPVVEDERVLQRVTVLDRGSGDVVEDHVHDAD